MLSFFHYGWYGICEISQVRVCLVLHLKSAACPETCTHFSNVATYLPVTYFKISELVNFSLFSDSNQEIVNDDWHGTMWGQRSKCVQRPSENPAQLLLQVPQDDQYLLKQLLGVHDGHTEHSYLPVWGINQEIICQALRLLNLWVYFKSSKMVWMVDTRFKKNWVMCGYFKIAKVGSDNFICITGCNIDQFLYNHSIHLICDRFATVLCK